MRQYYSAEIESFLWQSQGEVLGLICGNVSSAEISAQQRNAWEEEIAILQRQLRPLGEGRILFEYAIPRMGKRVDVVVLYRNIVFLLEFKCGERSHSSSAYDQVYDYAQDLRCFQEGSVDKLLVPIVVATEGAGGSKSFCGV